MTLPSLDVDAALAYLGFVEQRHAVWRARQAGAPQPWTTDPVVATRKFTNVYRVLDYGSQFLVSELLTPDLEPRDALARCFLYRYTNLPDTWRHVREELGRYPLAADLGPRLFAAIDTRRAAGATVFSGAYMILPMPNTPGDKVDQAITLAGRLFHPSSPDYVVPAFMAARTQAQRFQVLVQHKGVGPFMAMQVLTDWGYSPQAGIDREQEFVVPGPGCIKGAKALAPKAKALDVITWAREAVLAGATCPQLATPLGRQRPPSIMDIQNTLCEFSKYVRYASRATPLKAYTPRHPEPQPAPVLPTHW